MASGSSYAKFKCLYCDAKESEDISAVLFHGNDEHSSEIVKFKRLILSEQTGKNFYQKHYIDITFKQLISDYAIIEETTYDELIASKVAKPAQNTTEYTINQQGSDISNNTKRTRFMALFNTLYDALSANSTRFMNQKIINGSNDLIGADNCFVCQ